MKRLLTAFLLLLAAGLLLVQNNPGTSSQKRRSIVVYCAAGLKKPVEAIAAQFCSEFGDEIQVQYGGTGTLLSTLRTVHSGDLFISADAAGIEDGRRFNLLDEVLPIIRQKPVLAVPKGNPKHLFSLDDLQREGVRFAITNPESAAIGRLTRQLLGAGYDLLAKHATVSKPTVTDIANDLNLGTVDAALVWDSTVSQFPLLEAIPIPELSEHPEDASVAVLSCSKQPAAALRFARYLAAPEKGATIFSRMGFTPIHGDRWASSPELILYSGGVNRPAIEQLLKEFSHREGAQVTTVFNGCGVLCASMKTMGESSNPKFPDAYYACDLCFVPPVAEHFPQSWILTETEIGIVVQKGNPRGLQKLEDLAQTDLRLGLCNAEQSTLGYMTRGMLKSRGLTELVAKNVAVQVPTADFLINQMRAGALDAAIVYRVNVLPQSEHLEFLPISHPGAKAAQPFSIRSDTPNAFLAARLLQFLKKHRDRFEAAGFAWKGELAPIESSKIEIPAWLRPNQTQNP